MSVIHDTLKMLTCTSRASALPHAILSPLTKSRLRFSHCSACSAASSLASRATASARDFFVFNLSFEALLSPDDVCTTVDDAVINERATT